MACSSGPGPAPDRRLPGVRELVGVGGVVASLSVTSDLTRGHPPGEAMGACLLATELARRAGLDLIRQSEVYYGTLLRFVGCAATSHEVAAALGGDEVAVRAAGDLIDPTVPGEAQRFLAGLGVSASQRPARAGHLISQSSRSVRYVHATDQPTQHCRCAWGHGTPARLRRTHRPSPCGAKESRVPATHLAACGRSGEDFEGLRAAVSRMSEVHALASSCWPRRAAPSLSALASACALALR